jgi:hypothetical protein
MHSTFFASGRTPLYSAQWAPASAPAYAGSCVFLVALAAAWRALMAARAVLERRWLDRALDRRYIAVDGEPDEKTRVRDDAAAQRAVLLSPAGREEGVRVVRRHARAPLPWRLSVDVPRAAVVTVIAAVGYLL